MPRFDPNSFSDGIGRIEWKMLSEDDHVPLRNKVAARALSAGLDGQADGGAGVPRSAGIDRTRRVVLRRRTARRQPLLPLLDAAGMARSTWPRASTRAATSISITSPSGSAMDAIAPMAQHAGPGAEVRPAGHRASAMAPCPIRPGSMKQVRAANGRRSIRVNATIGQGYMLVNPLQLAVMAARIAIGQRADAAPAARRASAPQAPAADVHPASISTSSRKAMSEVVNGAGTARPRRSIADRRRADGRQDRHRAGRRAQRRQRQGRPVEVTATTAMFICFAPFDKPRYACAVVIEHGGGSGAAYPDRARRDDLPVRSGQGDGSAARAGEGLGRHAAAAHGSQVPRLCRAVRRQCAAGRSPRTVAGKTAAVATDAGTQAAHRGRSAAGPSPMPPATPPSTAPRLAPQRLRASYRP